MSYRVDRDKKDSAENNTAVATADSNNNYYTDDTYLWLFREASRVNEVFVVFLASDNKARSSNLTSSPLLQRRVNGGSL